MRTPLAAAILSLAALLLAGCAGDTRHELLISVQDQRMVVLDEGQFVAAYPVSTSKFGLGSTPNSNFTPVGRFKIKEKIGTDLPSGAVLKHRRPTGEILAVDAPGRDPIVTRILWLDGQDPGNQNAHDRYIYIHGTPEESTIGTPASFGCIRMRSRDVIALYDRVGSGARVRIQENF